jgi:hypothetical protein
MADDLSQTIKQTAEGPAAVNIDGNSVTAQDPLKQIAVDKHLASKSAVARKHRGLRFSRTVNPGTV